MPNKISMEGDLHTTVIAGNGKSGFDSGEGTREMTTTSKEGSRRANYPLPVRGGGDKKYRCGTLIEAPASLAPVAAVTLAPIAYIEVPADKILVVESRYHCCLPVLG
ncbi:unnamed protein product [Schistocephalus solidus]|uniref:Uncharacterized protein n=1 Tax=Schistocephalus solidus TaxID=70667 RepID=A0A3P7DI30_SCHSO|nr:unnamed protein product [Schistocephalus solidus]